MALALWQLGRRDEAEGYARKALASPFVLERFRQLDTEADGGTPEEFLALVRSETPKWAEVVRRSGAKVD